MLAGIGCLALCIGVDLLLLFGVSVLVVLHWLLCFVVCVVFALGWLFNSVVMLRCYLSVRCAFGMILYWCC